MFVHLREFLEILFISLQLCIILVLNYCYTGTFNHMLSERKNKLSLVFLLHFKKLVPSQFVKICIYNFKYLCIYHLKMQVSGRTSLIFFCCNIYTLSVFILYHPINQLQLRLQTRQLTKMVNHRSFSLKATTADNKHLSLFPISNTQYLF